MIRGNREDAFLGSRRRHDLLRRMCQGIAKEPGIRLTPYTGEVNAKQVAGVLSRKNPS